MPPKKKTSNQSARRGFRLGPLEPLLRDPTVSDILVNNAHTIYIERKGRLQKTTTRFRDDRHLMQVIDASYRASGAASTNLLHGRCQA